MWLPAAELQGVLRCPAMALIGPYGPQSETNADVSQVT